MAIGQPFFSIQKRKRNKRTHPMNLKLRLFQKYKVQIVVLATKLGPTLSPDVLVTLNKGDMVINLCLVQIVGDVDLKESNSTMPDGKEETELDCKTLLSHGLTHPRLSSDLKHRVIFSFWSFSLSCAQYTNTFPKSMIHL